jgi:tetratricopeptide (TPR) repeat protein
MVASQLDLSVLSTAAVLNNSGLALHTQGLHLEALEKFHAGLALEPNNPVILNNLGVCFFSLDLFQEAIQSTFFLQIIVIPLMLNSVEMYLKKSHFHVHSIHTQQVVLQEKI